MVYMYNWPSSNAFIEPLSSHSQLLIDLECLLQSKTHHSARASCLALYSLRTFTAGLEFCECLDTATTHGFRCVLLDGLQNIPSSTNYGHSFVCSVTTIAVTGHLYVGLGMLGLKPRRRLFCAAKLT